MSRRKLTDEECIAVVREYQDGKGGYSTISKKYEVSEYAIRNLVNRAKSEGIDFIKSTRTNKKYLAETKIKAVEEYLSGKSSQFEICAKYKITSRSFYVTGFHGIIMVKTLRSVHARKEGLP